MKDQNKKDTDRIEVLLLVLAYIAILRTAKIEDLTEISGCSRTALFRLFQIVRNPLRVQLVSIRGKGYEIRNWGVLDRGAVLEAFSERVHQYLSRKSLEMAQKKNLRQPEF